MGQPAVSGFFLDDHCDRLDDNVNHPKHYTEGKYECIEILEDILGSVGYTGYLRGNIMKYMWRYTSKNGVEDLRKARWYLDTLISYLDDNFPQD